MRVIDADRLKEKMALLIVEQMRNPEKLSVFYPRILDKIDEAKTIKIISLDYENVSLVEDGEPHD